MDKVIYETEVKDLERVNDWLDNIVNCIWSMPVVGNVDVTTKHSYIINKVAMIKQELGLTLDVKQPEEKKSEFGVFEHSFQLSEHYFGAFKNKTTFIKTGMKKGRINFRIENHEIDKNTQNVRNSMMYKFAMAHPNKVFYTPVRDSEAFNPKLWAE